MKVHNLMASHVAAVQPQRPPQTAVPAYTIHRTKEEWAHTNNTTGDVKIKSVQINTLMCPETGKTQEYRHPMKGLDKPK